MKNRNVKIDFNPIVVGKMTKGEFKKRFENIYPGADLDAAYERIVPKKRQKEQKQESEE